MNLTQALASLRIFDADVEMKSAPVQSKQADVEEIYRQRGQKELGDQEMSGMLISANSYLIRKPYIKELRHRELHVFAHPPRIIPVAIDPHGGGKTSRTAIIFMAHDEGKIVVRLNRHVSLLHAHDKVHHPRKFTLSNALCLMSSWCSALEKRVKAFSQNDHKLAHDCLVALRCDP